MQNRCQVGGAKARDIKLLRPGYRQPLGLPASQIPQVSAFRYRSAAPLRLNKLFGNWNNQLAAFKRGTRPNARELPGIGANARALCGRIEGCTAITAAHIVRRNRVAGLVSLGQGI
jgi:hypothetical protein